MKRSRKLVTRDLCRVERLLDWHYCWKQVMLCGSVLWFDRLIPNYITAGIRALSVTWHHIAKGLFWMCPTFSATWHSGEGTIGNSGPRFPAFPLIQYVSRRKLYNFRTPHWAISKTQTMRRPEHHQSALSSLTLWWWKKGNTILRIPKPNKIPINFWKSNHATVISDKDGILLSLNPVPFPFQSRTLSVVGGGIREIIFYVSYFLCKLYKIFSLWIQIFQTFTERMILNIDFSNAFVFKNQITMRVCQAARLCPTLRDPKDCSPPGSSVCGILQAGMLEWVATPSSRGLPNPGIEPGSLMSPALAGRSFTTSATWEAPK